MLYEKNWNVGKEIHSIWIDTGDWALPLHIRMFKTRPNLFEGLVGKLLVFHISFLCFTYRIESWGFGKANENL